MKKRSSLRQVMVVAGLLAAAPVLAHDLSPKGTRFDREAVKAWAPDWLDAFLSSIAEKGLRKFKESVHEEITHRAFGCNFEGSTLCGDPDAQFATPYVIAGVRWNDDPPFQLNASQATGTGCKTAYADGRPMTIRFITQPRCWASLFLGVEKQLHDKPGIQLSAANQTALPLRSHFGDLQFLHSMASLENEPPTETQAKVLAWAELTWGVVRGDLKLESWLKDVELSVAKDYFGSSGWRIQELFTLGDPSIRGHVSDVAFGSLLHMVQDSFAAGHVRRIEPADGAMCPNSNRRAPGPIRHFHSYTKQSPSKHAAGDTRQAFVNSRVTPDAVDVARELVALRKLNANWQEVASYLRCVYQLTPDAEPAGPGAFAK